jgi:hypothetical protein
LRQPTNHGIFSLFLDLDHFYALLIKIPGGRAGGFLPPKKLWFFLPLPIAARGTLKFFTPNDIDRFALL